MVEKSEHFDDMLHERSIKREWAVLAVDNPDDTENHEDGTCHFIKRIPDFGNRWLRVIVNTKVTPNRFVTAFFDRRLRKKYASKSR